MKKPIAKDTTKPFIDRYLNRFIPKNQLYRLPKPISHFFGYRKHPHKEPSEFVVWIWAFIGPFCGIALLEGIAMTSPALRFHHTPLVIASFGAAAILSYNAIEAPLAQPRNAFFGHIISSIVGVGIAKLFRLSSNFADIQWLAGAVALGVASTVTSILNCRYPPGGAAALLAATNKDIINLGWYFVALVTLDTVLMLASALLLNNIQRQYPKFWWSAAHTTRQKPSDIEKVRRGSTAQEHMETSSRDVENERAREIIITAERIVLPDDIELEGEEQRVFEQVLQRLRLPRDPDDDSQRSLSIDLERRKNDDDSPSIDLERREDDGTQKDKETFFDDASV